MDIEAWARAATLSTIELDCVTAIQLKILDGKCKMSREGKSVMSRI